MASPFDLARIQAETNIASLEHFEETGSTNDRAIEFSRSLSLPNDSIFPRLILADHQTAGRGQRNRKWISAAGSLTFSLCLNLNAKHSDSVEAEDNSNNNKSGFESEFGASPIGNGIDPAFALFVGLAICEAVDPFLDGERLQMKWPNDVLLQGNKLAGVLVERIPIKPDPSPGFPTPSSAVTVIGIGLNANNESIMETIREESDSGLVDYPTILPTSLRSTFKRQFDLTSLTISIVNRILDLNRSSYSDRIQLIEACERRMVFQDRDIKLILPNKALIEGRFIGLSELGELRLWHNHTETRIQSGSIVGWQ